MKAADVAIPDALRRPELESSPKVWGVHLLDHDPAGQAAVEEFLDKAGFLVTASSNVPDALDYLARSRPDILIASMEYPGLSLPRLMYRVKALSPDTHVLLTSVRSDWGAYEEARIYGAAALVMRPIQSMMLLRAVERVIEVEGVPAKGLAAR